MNKFLSRAISTNQQGVHPDLEVIVLKHKNSDFLRPVSNFNKDAFSEANQYYQRYSGRFILDSGCGVGESTFHIARKNPDCFVLGIDQSEHRLDKNNDWQLPDNAKLIRADLIDFWRLAKIDGWKLQKHFLLYPNPWPKKKHFQRRWHGHPVFPILQKFGGQLELRSNWKTYLDEFKIASDVIFNRPSLIERWSPEKTITPFERKYLASGQDLYRLHLEL